MKDTMSHSSRLHAEVEHMFRGLDHYGENVLDHEPDAVLYGVGIATPVFDGPACSLRDCKECPWGGECRRDGR